MKTRATIGICILALASLTGCATYHTDTQKPRLRQNEMMQFSISKPISIQNVAPQKGEIKIGSGIGWKLFGDYHHYTDSSIATLKSEFAKRGMPTSGNAAKIIRVEIIFAEAKSGAFTFESSARLKIQTGNGLEREYEGRQKFFNIPEATEAIENSIAHCIEQMLNDKELVSYITK